MNPISMDIDVILKKALDDQKITPDEAIHLCTDGDLVSMAMVAREIARRHNPDEHVGFAVTKTVRYSNVCKPDCPFCVGAVTQDHPAAFTKSAEDVVAEVAEAVAAGATQIVLQGGHRLDLPWSYYPGLVKAIRDRFPDVQVLAYSVTEIVAMMACYQKPAREIVGELVDAGMGAFMAGGSETLPERAKEYRSMLEGPWNPWIDVTHRCRDAHIPVIAPFVFGLGESARERVGLLYRLKTMHERSCMVKLPIFTAIPVFTLTGAQEAVAVTGHEYLRMVALARILAPNIPHIQSSFVAQGAKVAQVALDGGADDLGGTHLEFTQAELAAGRTGAMTATEMIRLIEDAGRTPYQRPAW